MLDPIQPKKFSPLNYLISALPKAITESDRILLMLLLLYIAFGIIILTSASEQSLSLIERQLFRFALGLGCMLLASNIHH